MRKIWAAISGTMLLGCYLGLCCGQPPAASSAPSEKPTSQALEFFESKVRPVLAERCFRCHGPEKQKGGLRLDSREGMLKGSTSGPVIVPGQPEKSLVIEADSAKGRGENAA